MTFRPGPERARLSVVFAVLCGVVLAIAHPSLVAAQAAPYRILVTNDDGIHAPGIAALARELSRVGEVLVVAPAENQSGSSMASQLGAMLLVEQVTKDGELFGYAVRGRPADAVLFGLTALAGEDGIDLVVSGINYGSNVGDIAHLSGTVGAAMMGLYLGVPAVAVSLEHTVTDYEFAARYTASFVSELKRRGAPSGVVLSINIPAGSAEEINGVVVAPMGGKWIGVSGFERTEAEGERAGYMPITHRSFEFEPGTDSDAYHRFMITITPLKFDWTDYEVLGDLKEWNLTVR